MIDHASDAWYSKKRFMHILWHGQSCFSLSIKERQSGKDVTVVLDPYSPDIGLTLPRNLSGDVVLVTHGHFDHAYVAGVSGDPFVIAGPGEYETHGVFVYGIQTWHDQKEGKERGSNTAYRIEAEGISLVHLGDLGERINLDDTRLEHMKDVDILFVPVGGTYTLDAKEAADVVQEIEPRIVIPMHYALPKLTVKLGEVQPFLKALGVADVEQHAKFTIREKDLPQDEMRVVVLTP